MATIKAPSLMDVMAMYPLKDDEAYNLYFLRSDGWPYGFACASRNPEDIQSRIESERTAPGKHSLIGIWVTKESNNGVIDVTIYRQTSLRR